MKFKSRKSILINILVYGISVLLIGACIVEFINNGFMKDSIAVYPIMLCVISFLLSILHYTGYELKDNTLHYHSSFINGKIAVSRIREIIKGKTMHTGFKPATASNGLIIKYDKFEELYISPNTNDSFIEAILKIKSDIVITE